MHAFVDIHRHWRWWGIRILIWLQSKNFRINQMKSFLFYLWRNAIRCVIGIDKTLRMKFFRTKPRRKVQNLHSHEMLSLLLNVGAVLDAPVLHYTNPRRH